MANKTKNMSRKKNDRFLIVLITIVSIAIAFVAFGIVQKVFQTETYYVLKENVPTRTQVTPEMMEPITTSEGTAPKNALGLSAVESGNVYTKYPLDKGDILTESNVGALQDVSVGIPDSWVITNFSVNADNAVGGRIRRGTYFDIMVVSNDGAFYPFVNVLALDTTVNMASASSSEAADTQEAHQGQTSQYVVGLSPENAAKLQAVMKKYGSDVRLVLSPRANEYQKPALADYTGLFSIGSDHTPIWPGESKDGEVTDYTFTDMQRDKYGKPVGKQKNCSAGNAKIYEKNCAANDTRSESSDTTNGGDNTSENSDAGK